MSFAAVVFDFHGTLARPAEGVSGYRHVLARRGFPVDEFAIEEWVRSFDGAEHSEHSLNEGTYGKWVRLRLARLADIAGVPSGSGRDVIVDELDRWGHGPVVAYRESGDVLRSLKTAGLRVAVCSNWGWQLDPFIEQAGLHTWVDIAITSARAGARKPHPSIFAHTINALGIEPARLLFVGDNFRADVAGPLEAGFGGAVHVWRPESRIHDEPTPLPSPHAFRVSDLTGVLDIVWPEPEQLS